MLTELSFGALLKRRRLSTDPHVSRVGNYVRPPSRVGRQLTQEEVSEAVGVSREWYAMLEAGSAHASTALAGRLADLFEMDADDRVTLIGLAAPDLEAVLMHVKAAPDADLLAHPPQPSVSLVAIAPDAIEDTGLRLARVREQFLMNGASVHGARRRILDSWLRSAAMVDCNQRTAPRVAHNRQLAELRDAHERLLRAAQPVVTFLVDKLSAAGYVVVLTDNVGHIMDLQGDLGVRRELARIGFVAGGDWGEAAAGTNAIGTALTDGRPLQLMGAEHFCEGWQQLTCTAAPIRDPDTQSILGALDITGGYRLIRAHLLALIMQCALDIEENLALSR